MKGKCVFPNLRAEMARADLTQQDLADALGVDRRTVNRKLCGAYPWKEQEQDRLAALFGTDREQLFRK